MTTTAPRSTAPPPASNGRPAPAQPKTFARSRGRQQAAIAVVLYGTGGIGKSSLAAMAPSPVFIDIERSTTALEVDRIEGIETWADLRQCLNSQDLFNEWKTLVIDSATAAEELCRKHVIANVKTDKNATVTSIEGYGWGKGYVHLFEEWRRLLGDLDNHRRAGRNVVLVCHERIGKVPNPSGDDYIRYEPRLYHGNQASVLHPTKEWADEVLFVSYDVAAADGKAKGSGTRTIYTTETATHMAKTRRLSGDPIVFDKGSDLVWQQLTNPSTTTDDLPPM